MSKPQKLEKGTINESAIHSITKEMSLSMLHGQSRVFDDFL